MARPSFSTVMGWVQGGDLTKAFAALISGKNPDGTSWETTETPVSQQFTDWDGSTVKRVVNPSAAIYLVQVRVRIFTTGEYVIQLHDTANAPSSATGRVRSYRVAGSATGAVAPQDLFPDGLHGGVPFEDGCWISVHDGWADPTAWDPAAALFCEIDTWHVPAG